MILRRTRVFAGRKRAIPARSRVAAQGGAQFVRDRLAPEHGSAAIAVDLRSQRVEAPQPMDVSIVEQTDSIALVALTGRFDTAGVDRVEARVDAALPRKGHARALVDQAIRRSAVDDVFPVAANLEESRAPLAG